VPTHTVVMSDLLTFQHPFDAARLKVARAEEHIREFEREVRVYLDTHPYEFIRSSQVLANIADTSVSMGDPRAAYAVVQDGRIGLRRVAYDTERAAGRVAELPLTSDRRRRLTALIRHARLP
jgi:hypothetical protein